MRPGPVAVLLLTGAVLGSCGPSAGGAVAPPPREPSVEAPSRPANEPRGGRPPRPAERAVIDQLVRVTARVRELRLLRPVPVEIQDPSRITAELLAQLEPEQLLEAQQLYTALGLLEPDLDLLALLTSVLAEQVVGFYDPEGGRLVVRDDVMDELRAHGSGPTVDEARVVLIHELVHALQDQLLGLGERYEDERDADADNAFRSVVEGDATLAMLGYIVQEQGGTLDMMIDAPGGLGSLLDTAGPLPGDLLAQAPAIVRVSLVVPYLKGAVFCSHLYRDGGWSAVNAAHLALPRSMEQVLHYEKYIDDELPDPIVLPGLPGLEAAGYVAGPEDSLGELELGVYLGQDVAEGADPEAVVGWSGDRARVYLREGAPLAVVWFTSWDDRSAARRVELRARRLLHGLDDATRLRHRVERRGRTVLILRNLPPELQPAIVDRFESFARALARRPPHGPRRTVAQPAPP